VSKRKRHSPGQVIEKLREADVALSQGVTLADVCKKLEVSEQTYHRWRATYGGMKGPEMKRLKELERENTQLKKIVADMTLDAAMLRELARGNF
jgi:transposase-like protein